LQHLASNQSVCVDNIASSAAYSRLIVLTFVSSSTCSSYLINNGASKWTGQKPCYEAQLTLPFRAMIILSTNRGELALPLSVSALALILNTTRSLASPFKACGSSSKFYCMLSEIFSCGV